MPNWLKDRAIAALRWYRLPPVARHAALADRRGPLGPDPGAERVIDAGLDWLCTAQDRSATNDGGVARHFSLIDGWGASYPETTGYIIPTMLEHGLLRQSGSLVDRARRMLDWLVAIQFPDGAFQGGMINQTPVVPVTFNTGQILLGLASGAATLGDEYRAPMRAAADWLVRTQDADGCWRRNSTPFAAPGEKAYETHVAWGLMEAARVEGDTALAAQYAEAAFKNVDWAMTKEQVNGFFLDNCLTSARDSALTHTIGYLLRGLLEAYLLSRSTKYLEASKRVANGVLSAVGSNGFLPGRLNADWHGSEPFCCLTGSSQIAYCLLKMSSETGDERYRDGGRLLNEYVRRTVCLDGDLSIRGGVKGSHPIDAAYGTFQYLNWACKFTIDANRLELQQDKSG